MSFASKFLSFTLFSVMFVCCQKANGPLFEEKNLDYHLSREAQSIKLNSRVPDLCVSRIVVDGEIQDIPLSSDGKDEGQDENGNVHLVLEWGDVSFDSSSRILTINVGGNDTGKQRIIRVDCHDYARWGRVTITQDS